MPNVSPVFILKTKNAAGVIIQAATRVYQFIGQVAVRDLGAREVEVNVGAVGTQSGFTIIEDWINNSTSGNNNWANNVNGVGASITVNTTNLSMQHWGIVRLTVGNAASRAAIQLATNFLLGDSTVDISMGIFVSNLSTALEEYVARFGWQNSATVDPTSGIYFEYDRTQSVNWLIKTAAGGVRTTTDTGIPVAAGVWTGLQIHMDQGQVDYYINGVLAGSITTNIPQTLTAQLSNPQMSMNKTVGGGSRTIDLDYYLQSANFTNPRY